MVFDIRTLCYATAFVLLGTGAATWFVYGTQRRFPGSGLWTVGMCLAAIGCVLVGLRGHAPEYLSQRLSNVALIFTAAVLHHAIARFSTARTSSAAPYALASLFAVPFLLGPWVPLTTSQRIVLFSAATAVLYALCTWEVLAHCRGRVARVLLGVSWASLAGMGVVRAILTSLEPEVGDFMTAGPVHAVAFLHAIVACLMTSFGFLILVAERLQNEIEAQGQNLALRNADLRDANARLSAALEQVRTLQGILPICSGCKKIRNDAGYWHQVEDCISAHTDAEFTHSLCPDCMQGLYGKELADEVAEAIAAEARTRPTERCKEKKEGASRGGGCGDGEDNASDAERRNAESLAALEAEGSASAKAGASPAKPAAE